jgi:hypothetical protein
LVSIIAQHSTLQQVSSLQGYNVEFQQKVVEKTFVHDVMKPLLSTYLSNILVTKHNHLIVESIKDGVSAHLARGCTLKHTFVKEFLGTLAVSIETSAERLHNTLGCLKGCTS